LVGEEEGYEGTAEKQAELKAEQASRAARAAATARSRAELRGVAGGDERRTVRWEDVFLQVKNDKGVFMKWPIRHLLTDGGSNNIARGMVRGGRTIRFRSPKVCFHPVPVQEKESSPVQEKEFHLLKAASNI
jgi:hypothetical protein